MVEKIVMRKINASNFRKVKKMKIKADIENKDAVDDIIENIKKVSSNHKIGKVKPMKNYL